MFFCAVGDVTIQYLLDSSGSFSIASGSELFENDKVQNVNARILKISITADDQGVSHRTWYPSEIAPNKFASDSDAALSRSFRAVT